MWSEQGSAEYCHLHYKCVITYFDHHVEKKNLLDLVHITIHLQLTTSAVPKDTGTEFEPHFTFAMLNYFSANQYEEP